MYSGVDFLKRVFQTRQTPSGSCGESCNNSRKNHHLSIQKNWKIKMSGTYFVVMIRCNQQLWKLWRPIHARHTAIARPAFVIEAAVQMNLVARTVIAEKKNL
jgi:hypothetical protein